MQFIGKKRSNLVSSHDKVLEISLSLHNSSSIVFGNSF